jgi:hypothetical protein
MTDAAPPRLTLLAKLVVGVAVSFMLIGGLWHGISFARFWRDLVERTADAMKFRLALQPTMAAILAIRDGLKYASTGHPPYFTTKVLRDPRERGRLREGLVVGLNATAKILVVGLIMDGIYQACVLRTFYPFEALVVALLLGFVPYAIIRGLVVRMERRRASNRKGR